MCSGLAGASATHGWPSLKVLVKGLGGGVGGEGGGAHLRKACRLQILLRSMDVDLLMATVQIASQHHRLLGSQLLQVCCKMDVPLLQSIV